jgi:hypothetical protein
VQGKTVYYMILQDRVVQDSVVQIRVLKDRVGPGQGETQQAPREPSKGQDVRWAKWQSQDSCSFQISGQFAIPGVGLRVRENVKTWPT